MMNDQVSWIPSLLVLQVLIRLIGADEHIYANYAEAMRWLEDSDVLEMIVDKFSSSVSGFLQCACRFEKF